MGRTKFVLDKALINTKRYIELPTSSQALYIQLNSEADDNGIVDAYPIIQKIRADMQDLMALVRAGFVVILDVEEQIVFITHWTKHNSAADIRWHKPSEHLALLANVMPNASVVAKLRINKKYVKKNVSASEALELQLKDENVDDILMGNLDDHTCSLENLTNNKTKSNINKYNNKTTNNNKTNQLDQLQELDEKYGLLEENSIPESFKSQFAHDFNLETLKKYVEYVDVQRGANDRTAYLIQALNERWLD